MKILLVEDDYRIAKPLAEDLRYQHHVVDAVMDGLDAWDHIQTASYDLILLDIMLPGIDGITLCKRLRSSGYGALILMLTAKDSTTDKVIGLDAGADDYLIKPFELEELSARIRALSRRSAVPPQAILRHEKIQLDLNAHVVTYDGTALNLTPKEYMILECFLKAPAQVFPRAILLDQLWELDQTSGEETIRTHIANLRRKLKMAGCETELIETIYGVGYRLAAENLE